MRHGLGNVNGGGFFPGKPDSVDEEDDSKPSGDDAGNFHLSFQVLRTHERPRGEAEAKHGGDEDEEDVGAFEGHDRAWITGA